MNKQYSDLKKIIYDPISGIIVRGLPNLILQDYGDIMSIKPAVNKQTIVFCSQALPSAQ